MPTISLNSQPWTITPIQWVAQFYVTVKGGNSHVLHTSDYATLIGPTGYDPLNRLTSASGPQGAQGYSYDANGNRLSATINLNGNSSSNSYTQATNTNRLQAITGPNAKTYSYDANGNTRSDGLHNYHYNAQNRLISVDNTIHYRHNGLGQRTGKTVSAINTSNTSAGDANGDGTINAQDYSAILNQILGTPASHNADCNQDGQINVQDLVCINIKINPTLQTAGTTHYAYDEQSQLIGEYDQNGAAIQETIYLGNLPVAVIKQGNLYRLYADHLNTPRAITDTTNKVVWRWQSDAFGTTAANEDADGDGTQFNYNLRFPGQYLDQETGLHYNYFRDYNPHTGRYVQSDPIGLAGGLNTYIYVGNNPLYWIDPLGLAVAVPMPAPVVIPGFRLPSPNPWWMIIYPKPAGEGADIVPPGPYYNEDAQAPGCPTEADGFKPKKNWNGEKVKNPNGPGYGWPDNKGNVWVPTGPGSSAHGGPHWDVQIPGRANDYINIYPGGKTRPGRR